jgi:hypothetical protein
VRKVRKQARRTPPNVVRTTLDPFSSEAIRTMDPERRRQWIKELERPIQEAIPLHVARWFEATKMYRSQDRISALTMLALIRSPSRPGMDYKERHFLTAFHDGECIFHEGWRLEL